MKFQLLPSPKGPIARLVQEDEWKLGGLDDFLDLIASSPSDTIALDREALPEAFFDLRSGIAGEMLQKASNYRRRLAILGMTGDAKGRALADFIRESNRTGKVVFVPGLEEAVALLR